MASKKFLPFRSSLGLLTTVEKLSVSQQNNLVKKDATIETPLDLTVKPVDSYVSPSIQSPIKKRYRDEEFSQDFVNTKTKCIKTELKLVIKNEVTPEKPIKSVSVSKTNKVNPSPMKEKKSKAVRRLKFDEDNSSPVSGTIIRSLQEIDANFIQESGDIDPQYNIVEVTEEAKAELTAITNVIGAYICKLCQNEFEDAFGLARHRCSCIVLLEYRCPECGKRFNCPANLASHRRWHKPKELASKKQEDTENEKQYPCEECGKHFKRQSYLKKHIATHKNKKIKENCKKTIPSQIDYNSSESIPDEFQTQNSLSSEQNNNFFSKPNDDEMDTESTSSTNSSSFVSSSNNWTLRENQFTEEENMAAAVLTHLRTGSSVIRHTTALIV